jgi:hypothetical protein
MKIVVRAKADEDLDGIFAWIAKDSPRAAVDVIRRIRNRIGRLATPGLEHMVGPVLNRAHVSLSSRHMSSSMKCTTPETRSRYSLSCTGREIGRGTADSGSAESARSKDYPRPPRRTRHTPQFRKGRMPVRAAMSEKFSVRRGKAIVRLPCLAWWPLAAFPARVAGARSVC